MVGVFLAVEPVYLIRDHYLAIHVMVAWNEEQIRERHLWTDGPAH